MSYKCHTQGYFIEQLVKLEQIFQRISYFMHCTKLKLPHVHSLQFVVVGVVVVVKIIGQK